MRQIAQVGGSLKPLNKNQILRRWGNAIYVCRDREIG